MLDSELRIAALSTAHPWKSREIDSEEERQTRQKEKEETLGHERDNGDS